MKWFTQKTQKQTLSPTLYFLNSGAADNEAVVVLIVLLACWDGKSKLNIDDEEDEEEEDEEDEEADKSEVRCCNQNCEASVVMRTYSPISVPSRARG